MRVREGFAARVAASASSCRSAPERLAPPSGAFAAKMSRPVRPPPAGSAVHRVAMPGFPALTGCVAGAAVLYACGGAVLDSTSTADAGPTGEIEAQMQLPAGTVLGSATYVLTRAGGFRRTATMPFDGLARVAFSIAQVPPADLYELDVTESAPNGSETCISSAQFPVTPMQTTMVWLAGHCSRASSAAGH